jgi:uncharacterized protein YcfJ
MYNMKHLLITASLVVATASPALAETSNAHVQDHYKTVIEQKPYKVEVCKNVNVPYGSKKELDTEGAIIGGIIGGVIGNQFGKGDGKEAMTGIGALSGAIIGGKKDAGPKGYRTETQCHIETRYEETEREVYSHSTVTFYADGVKRTLKFQK